MTAGASVRELVSEGHATAASNIIEEGAPPQPTEPEPELQPYLAAEPHIDVRLPEEQLRMPTPMPM